MNFLGKAIMKLILEQFRSFANADKMTKYGNDNCNALLYHIFKLPPSGTPCASMIDHHQ